MSQIEFASKLDVKQGAMSKYELGTNDIPSELATKLKEIFQINLNWLFCGEGKPFLDSGDDQRNENSFDRFTRKYLEKSCDINDPNINAYDFIEDTKKIKCENCVYWQTDIPEKNHIKKCVMLDINTSRTFFCKNHETLYSTIQM